MNSCVYGVGGLNPADGYPRLPEGHKVDCMPVDFFVPIAVGEQLVAFFASSTDAWTGARTDCVEKMVGECACAALMPEVATVSSCDVVRRIELGDGMEMVVRTTYQVISATAIAVLLEHKGEVSLPLSQWADEMQDVLDATGGIVLTGCATTCERL